MNNVGEELTAIYLRIQGFLQLTNFVIHRTYNNEIGECDILAVRLYNMKESIYSKDSPEIVSSFDYSDRVFDQDVLSLSKDVYLWVEVTLRKDVSKKYIEDKFSDSKCMYVIERLGIQDWVDLNHLSNNPFHINSKKSKIFAKVLVCENIPENKVNTCFYTSSHFIKKQLQDWFERYKEIKKRNWYAWVNPFLQGLAKQII